MKAKILVLEDYEPMRLEVQDTLADEDYEVESAESAADGIEIARHWEFDLLVTDVRMPGTADGLDALAAIKKLRPAVYSVIITGYAEDNGPARAMREGADFYLYKPFSPQKLLNVVQAVLDTQREHSTYQHQLARFFRGSKRFLESMLGKTQLPGRALDPTRFAFFKALYAGMQSKNLTANAALSLWDDLQELEQRYEALQQSLGPEADQLAESYQALTDKAVYFAETRGMGDLKPRKPGQMVMAFFGKLYQRAGDGAFSVPVLMAGPALWSRAHQQRPQGEMGALWDRLFGA